MSYFKRILSYLYRYDGGDKKDCKGFIKAEQRKDNLKLTIQIQDDLPISDFQVWLCFYQKEDKDWLIPFQKTIAFKNGQEENLIYYTKADLPEGFDIQRINGVLLYDQYDTIYGSVWIGEEIPEDVLALDNHLGLVKDTGNISKNREPNSRLGKEDKGKELNTSKGKENKVTEPDACGGKDDKGKELYTSKGKENKVTEPDACGGKENNGKRLENCDEKGSKDNEHLTTFVSEKLSLIGEKEYKDDNPDSLSDKANIGNANISSENRHELDELQESKEMMSYNPLEVIRSQAPRAEKIYNSAFYEGYQISHDQLIHLGAEADQLSDNQFLLKGYGRYHHLLAGKVQYDGEARYCIGVPGIYENKEKYMAQLYQFPIFLSMTENRVKTGGFGYWLHILPSV